MNYERSIVIGPLPSVEGLPGQEFGVGCLCCASRDDRRRKAGVRVGFRISPPRCWALHHDVHELHTSSQNNRKLLLMILRLLDHNVG